VTFSGRTPLVLTTCLLLGGLCRSAAAADKIRVEIVETTDEVLMLPRTFPGTPEQTNTHCDASAVGNTASGNCTTTVRPATEPTTGLMPSFNHRAKAILPDGSHANLVCFPWNKGCGVIAPLAPEKSRSNCEATGGNTTCVTTNLGFYQAKRNKGELVIYTPNGKVRYQIATGSW
jgi:hypothetical protein